MGIRLEEVTAKSFDECIKLKVREDQPFVAPNVYSIAQSKVLPRFLPRVIYAGEVMVGFVMFSYELDKRELYLCRLMIDARYQHKGFGVSTLEELKRLAMATAGIERIRLSTNPKNANGIRIYERFGFRNTGEIEDGEAVFVLELKSAPTDPGSPASTGRARP